MNEVVIIIGIGILAYAAYYIYNRNKIAAEVQRINQELKVAEIKENQKQIDIIKTKSIRTVEEYLDARTNYRNRYPKPPVSNDKPSGPQG